MRYFVKDYGLSFVCGIVFRPRILNSSFGFSSLFPTLFALFALGCWPAVSF